ncbi:cyclin-dependent kinase 7-like isoform X1 [Sycon ciliatum]|uniref:cyclin-dependent kinase 7-like isoform X1 n=1 Tax=Sycon ciliatum TaxID=27933 RepID=UPI0020AB5708|eukprot:scpid57787/ scgid10623/ Cyclin-dependent kinase 7; 40 kDa protein kinase; CDC2/CDK2,4-activating kinase; Cell division protein kinase 7; P40 MO15
MEAKWKRYRKTKFIGEGQFATVYQAEDLHNPGTLVAIKKIKVGQKEDARDGINRTALREIKLLQELKHSNVIGLLDVFGQRSNISLVFDFMDTDLEVIIRDLSIMLTIGHIKSYLIMTLKGLEYLHQNWVLHRDMKPNNLLLNSNGVLKITDFGLAKAYGSPNRVYTHHVVTRWYRAPELLFGARLYGTGIDMWAVGCIFAELMQRNPFLVGESDIDQLTKIFEVLGTPTDESWPGLSALPDYVPFKAQVPIPLAQIFTAADAEALSMLSSMLCLNPVKRCTCSEALKMPFFSSRPYPTKGPLLPLPSGSAVKNEEELVSRGVKRKRDEETDGFVKKKLSFGGM